MDYLNGYYELYHHGILGQKWGVRRYQNPDGSYTEAGKKRRAKEYVSAAKKSSSTNIKKNTSAHRTMSSIGREVYKNLSEDEKKVLYRSSKSFSDLARLDEAYREKARKDGNYKFTPAEIKKMESRVKKNRELDEESRKLAIQVAEKFLGKYKDVPIKLISGKKTLTKPVKDFLATSIENAATWDYALDRRRIKDARKELRKAKKDYKKDLKNNPYDASSELVDLAKMELDEVMQYYKKKYK